MYDYAYKTSVGGFYTFKLVTFIIAIAATIIIYTVFMDKRNKDTYSNPLKKLFDYLHFNKFFMEPILKITYIFCSLYITITAFGYIGTSFLLFFLLLILGNILLRMVFEGLMVIYKIDLTLNEINKKMK